jgi:hypothetical protein
MKVFHFDGLRARSEQDAGARIPAAAGMTPPLTRYCHLLQPFLFLLISSRASTLELTAAFNKNIFSL